MIAFIMSTFRRIANAIYILAQQAVGQSRPGRIPTGGATGGPDGHVIPPVGSSAVPVSGAMVRGRWNTLALSPITGSTAQIVQRSADGVTWTTIATLSPSIKSFSDPNPPAGINHYRAQDIPAGLFSVTVTIPPPAAPSNLTASYAAGVVTLTWTDNNSPSTGFTVERSVNFCDWTQIASLGAVTTTTDTPPAGNVFFYRARATTAAGVSLPSNWYLAGPAVYGWIRASEITGVADGASVGASLVDHHGGKMTLTRPTGSVWTYRAAGINGQPEIVCDSHAWSYNTTLAQPFSLVWVAESYGPNVSDTGPKQWLQPAAAPSSGFAIWDNQNPYAGFEVHDYGNGNSAIFPSQADKYNIWTAVVNGAASNLSQQGSVMAFSNFTSTTKLQPGTFIAPVGFSELLVLSAALSSTEQAGINAAFSQLTSIPMLPTIPTPAFDSVITPALRQQVFSTYALGAVGNTWYVSTTGSAANDGKTPATAWDIASALSPPANSIPANSIKPLDRLRLVGGTYQKQPRVAGDQGWPITLKGQPGAYIRIEAMPGHRVIMDGGLYVPSSNPAQYVKVAYLEVMVSETKLVNGQPIVFNTIPTPWPAGGANDSFGLYGIWHDLDLHDNNQNDRFDGVGTHTADCVVWNTGYVTDGSRAQGHGFYGHNLTGFPAKIFSGNVFGPNWSFGYHIFTTSGQIINVWIDGGTSFDYGDKSPQNAANLIQSINGTIQGAQLNNTISFNCSNTIGGLGRTDISAEALNNVLAGTSTLANIDTAWTAGYTQTGTVTNQFLTMSAYLRPHMYDANLATLSLFGDGSLSPVVDLSGFLDMGDTYRIVDVQQRWGTPLVTGIFDGAPITIPLPAGRAAFQCCLVYRTAAAVPSAPTYLSATPGTGQIVLNWVMSDYAWQSFTISRATVSGGPYTVIASGVTGTTYTDSAVTPGTTYFYQVEAVSVYGNSAESAPASGAAS